MPNHKFEKDKTCYEQHSESFRNLNNQLWQVPIIAMTLTGGVWFFAFSGSPSDHHKAAILIFSGICDLLFIPILFRVRFIMSLLIEKLNNFNHDYAIEPKKSKRSFYFIRQDNFVIFVFSAMLFIAGCGSIWFGFKNY